MRRKKLGRRAVWAVALSLALPSVHAQFRPPRAISATDGGVIQATVGVDLSFNSYVTWTAGGEMFVEIITSRNSNGVRLSEPGLGTGDPALVTNGVGTTFVAFTQDDIMNGGREVCLANNFGGTFSAPPLNISRGSWDDYAPHLYLGSRGNPNLVWTRSASRSLHVMYANPTGTEPLAQVIAEGEYPSLAIGRGLIHVIYSRDRDLFVTSNRLGRWDSEVRATRTPLDDEYFPSIAMSESGLVFASYESKGGLYFHESSDGGLSFGPARLQDNGGVFAPELRVTGELLTLVYEKQGDVYYMLGRVGGALLPPTQVIATPEVESWPSMAVDLRGNLHVSFIRNGEVYYTNNAGEVAAEFTSQTRQGEAPLEVQFTDLSRGVIDVWRWSFGDGSRPSYERNPVHVYQRPGRYTVSLEVYGVGENSEMEKENFVYVLEPDNQVWIPNQVVYPGQKDIWYPIVAQYEGALQGFQLTGTFDTNVLHLRRITYAGTALESTVPELFKTSMSNRPQDAHYFVGVIFDWGEPFEDQTLPPSRGERLTHLVFDCLEHAPRGGRTVVQPVNGFGPDKLETVFGIGGQGVYPLLLPSITEILPAGEPIPRRFFRGDHDWSGKIDLTDSITLLGYLFLGGSRPSCPDAADADDSGELDIADPIFLLNFLFLAGPQCPVPYPGSGLDPTPDALGPCEAP